MVTVAELRSRFARLHDEGILVLPNAWDLGSAHILESLGFAAVATTSSGLGASLGRMDQTVTLSELLHHVSDLTAGLEIPVSVDAENCYAPSVVGISDTVSKLAGRGAAGFSIEDYDPATGIYDLGVATERVRAAATAAQRHGLALTARAENHLYDGGDLEDTITRLQSYRDAGADVLYAPGLEDLAEISRVVIEVEAPINVLLLPSGPTIPELAEVGVRRVSTGGALAFAAYGILAEASRELLDEGTSDYTTHSLSPDDRRSAFS